MLDKDSKNDSKITSEITDNINLNSMNPYQRNQLNTLIKNEIQRIVNLTNESFNQRLLETNNYIKEFKSSITTQMETISGIQNEMYNCFRTNKKNFEKLNNIQTIMKNFEEAIENNKTNVENLKIEIDEAKKKNEKLLNEILAIPENIKVKKNLKNLNDFFKYLVNELNKANNEIKKKEINLNNFKTELNKIIDLIKLN